jgi:hypothetical protein
MLITESELRQLIREQYAWMIVLEARGGPKDLASAVVSFLVSMRGGELPYMSQKEFETLVKGKVAELVKGKNLNPSLVPQIEKHAIEMLSQRGAAPRKRPDRPSARRPQAPPPKKRGRFASFLGLGESEMNESDDTGVPQG